jgi:hypothetical protein
MSVFGFACLAGLLSFQHVIHAAGSTAVLVGALGGDPNLLLALSLIGCSTLLAVNVLVDVRIVGRASMSRAR